MRQARSGKRESRAMRNSFDDRRIASFLQRDNIRARRPDDLRDLLGASDAAFANVVREEPHGQPSDSAFGFFNNTKYG
jgi:hypothetical protein